jgi:tetratricopeptide (TPR) repeat protein
VTAGLIFLLASIGELGAQDEPSVADERQMKTSYELEMARGNQAAALKHVLDYTEKAYGENAPETVKVTHRYGHALYTEHRYREATDVLIKALERSIAAYGESGGEAFEINMNIGYAYSQWNPRLSARMKYFRRALEILRERGEHETITYVSTLVSIVVSMMDNDGLGGSSTSHLSDTMYSPEVTEYVLPIEQEYTNNYGSAERLIREAVEIGAKLENQDEFILAKIAIIQARLNVAETADLAAVPMGVSGYISGGTESDYYDREQERLTDSIEKLSENPELNRSYLHAANKALLEIAWLDKDKERMFAMCTDGVLDSAGEYSPDRLYEVSDNGTVFAPELGIPVSKNLFRRRVSRKEPQKDEFGNPVKKPYFIPVCVDGRLMAALINAPRVTVEELR